MKNKLFILLSLAAIGFSCKQRVQIPQFDQDIKPLVWEALPDSLLPPEVIPVTAANQPKRYTVTPKHIPFHQPYGLKSPAATNFGIKDGLPGSYVSGLTLDSIGNLWIGGIGFLSKYDGATFTNYSSENGMGSTFGNDIQLDQNGNLWLSDDRNLVRFDGQSFERISLDKESKDLIIYSIVQGKDGKLWTGTSNGAYQVIGDSIRHFGEEQGLKGEARWVVANTQTGELIAISEGALKKLENDLFVPFHINQNDGIRFRIAYAAKNGNLWFFGDKNGKSLLGRFDGTNTVFYPLPHRENVRFFYEDQSERIWVGFNKSLQVFDPDKVISYTYEELGMAGSVGQAMVEDADGNLWLGTIQGISKLNSNLFGRLDLQGEGDKKLESTNSNLTIDPLDRKWVTTNKELIQIKESGAEVYDLSQFLGERFIYDQFADQQGRIWMSTGSNRSVSNYLLLFDQGEVLVYDSKQYNFSINLSYISGDVSGNISFSGYGGLALFDGTAFTHFGSKQGIPSLISRYFVDSKNRQWFGTPDNGTMLIAGDSILRISTDNGLPNNFVNYITEDPFGTIWIATDGGASSYDGDKLTHYGKADGLGALVANIQIDSINHRIWFATSNDLASIPLEALKDPNATFTLYTPQNGYDFIPGMISSPQKVTIDSTGLWLLNIFSGSVVRFEYSRVQQLDAPQLMLNAIRVDNSHVLWSVLAAQKEPAKNNLLTLNESNLRFGEMLDSASITNQVQEYAGIKFSGLQRGGFIPEDLKLPFKNNSIAFEFAAISPGFGKNMQYRYKLEGFEKNWSPRSKTGEASFGSLPEGKYTLQVEAFSPFGTTSTMSYSFTVLPPWHRTWWAYAAYILLFISGIYLFIRWRTKALKKDKQILEHKVNVRTNELRESLENLKSTQTQLIQSEKMASLGELTAGIAHEIQNPLNFVNNFSEVNTELIDELREEVDKGNLDEVKAIAKDIKENGQKINHHGKRADAIVKGMLQHSRTTSGQKELTDINALADEYLRLAYHGLRAKDKSFNATMKTEFDESIGKINVIPQDIGRVILNLITNAFYTVDEKKKSELADYEPTVTISTKKEGDNIEIRVNDNGNGIPESIKEKIFQPFFTTKPTGQGTGLGLSLAYDIVTKGHGGELKVETKEGEGTTLSIRLPI